MVKFGSVYDCRRFVCCVEMRCSSQRLTAPSLPPYSSSPSLVSHITFSPRLAATSSPLALTMVAAAAQLPPDAPETTTAVAGPSRPLRNDTWTPSRYLEPNHPDNEEVLEQAAYQAAVTRPPGDSRGNRKYKPRRTVDYMGSVQKWRMVSAQECRERERESGSGLGCPDSRRLARFAEHRTRRQYIRTRVISLM
jgi:hypothetical protein